MSWLERLPWSRRSSDAYAKTLLGPFLGRNPDPKTLTYYSSLLQKGATARKLLDEVTQNLEYKSFFHRQTTDGAGKPCVWNAGAYEAYSNDAKIDDILVVKLDHIGDFILALDSFQALRTAFPAARITLLCGPWNAQLARATGFFDRVETLDFFATTADGGRADFSRHRLADVGSARFDVAIDLRFEPDTRVVLDHLTATHKCGYASDVCRSPMTVALPRPNLQHCESLSNNQRLAMLGLTHNVIHFFRRDSELGGAALAQKLVGATPVDLSFRAGKPLVVLHPFSGRAIKNWPLENFLKLAAWLSGEHGACVVLLGSKAEAESVPGLAQMCDAAGAKSLAGETSLAEAVAIIASADLFIGNDSGLTHVAARLDIPTFAIFSGVSPIEMWAPYGRHATIIHTPVDCAPCYLPSLDDCPHGHRCLGAIDADFVLELMRSRLPPCFRSVARGPAA